MPSHKRKRSFEKCKYLGGLWFCGTYPTLPLYFFLGGGGFIFIVNYNSNSNSKPNSNSNSKSNSNANSNPNSMIPYSLVRKYLISVKHLIHVVNHFFCSHVTGHMSRACALSMLCCLRSHTTKAMCIVVDLLLLFSNKQKTPTDNGP